ncbi:MAG: ATP synthase subunit I [Thioalkalispiraceae bacterium]|jgi:ATP synthase protein I
MNFADKAFQRTWRRLVLIQVSLLVVAAVMSLLLKGYELNYLGALFYGGAISIVSTLINAWRIRIATESAADNAALSMVELYKGLILRMVVVMALLAIGFITLKLQPAALIIGFVVAHTGYLFARPVGTARRRVG